MRIVSKAFTNQQELNNQRIINQVLVSKPLIPPLGSPNFEFYAHLGQTDVVKGLALTKAYAIGTASLDNYKIADGSHWSTLTSSTGVSQSYYVEPTAGYDYITIYGFSAYLKVTSGFCFVSGKIYSDSGGKPDLTSFFNNCLAGPTWSSAGVTSTTGAWYDFICDVPLTFKRGTRIHCGVVNDTIGTSVYAYRDADGGLGTAFSISSAPVATEIAGATFYLKVNRALTNLAATNNIFLFRSNGSYTLVDAVECQVPTAWAAGPWLTLPNINGVLHDAVCKDATIRVFSVDTVYSSGYGIYMYQSDDFGVNWRATYTYIGTSLLSQNKLEVRSSFDAVYLKNTETTGITIECFKEPRAGDPLWPWSRTVRATQLLDARDFNTQTGFTVAKQDVTDYLLFTGANQKDSVGQLQYMTAVQGIMSLPQPVLGFEDPKQSSPVLRPGIAATTDSSGRSRYIMTGQIFRGYANPIADDFESYDSNWKTVAVMNSTENWTTDYGSLSYAAVTDFSSSPTANIVPFISGSTCLKLTAPSAPNTALLTLNLATPVPFLSGDEDFILFYYAMVSISGVNATLVLTDSAGKTASHPLNYSYLYGHENDGPANKLNVALCKKKFFTVAAGFDWSTIKTVSYGFSSMTVGPSLYTSTLYFCKVDSTPLLGVWNLRYGAPGPSDPSDYPYPNPTGGTWIFYNFNYYWLLLNDDPLDSLNTVLAYVKSDPTALTPAQGLVNYHEDTYSCALYYSETKNQDYRLKTRVLIRDYNRTDVTNEREAGVLFRASMVQTIRTANDYTTNSWYPKGYSATIEYGTSHSHLRLRKWVGTYGDPTNILTSYDLTTFTLNTWWWIGIDVKGSIIKVYAAPEEDSLVDLWTTTPLITYTDTTYTDGRIGFIAYNTQARFDDLMSTAYASIDTDEGIGFGASPLLAAYNSTLMPSLAGDVVIPAGDGYIYTFDRNGNDVYRGVSPFATDAQKEYYGHLLNISDHARDWSIVTKGGSTPQAGTGEFTIDNPAIES
jgi:hypothetical protein